MFSNHGQCANGEKCVLFDIDKGSLSLTNELDEIFLVYRTVATSITSVMTPAMLLTERKFVLGVIPFL